MRIVFHLKYFRAGRIGGQEGVIRRLATGLADRPLSPGQCMFALAPAAEHAALAEMCDWAGIEALEADAGERAAARSLRELRPDLYLCPMAAVEPADPPCPTVALIPDLQHETFPEFFTPEVLANRRTLYGRALRRADLVLTPSSYARRTILARYPDTPPERILTAHPGVDPAFAAPAPPGAAQAGPFAEEGYLLYPANFWPHKNHQRLLEALAGLRSDGLAPPLVLTGDPRSGFERIEREAARLELSGQVRFLGHLPVERFVELLRGARALVFPSLYEGFGLPILEAFHCDTPVLCSNVASCPEVAGGAALLVDPASAPAIEAGVRRIWTDASLRAELVEKGRRRRVELLGGRTLETVRAAMLRLASQPKRRTGPAVRLLRALGVGSLTP